MNFAVYGEGDDGQFFDILEALDAKIALILSQAIDRGLINDKGHATKNFAIGGDGGHITYIAQGMSEKAIRSRLQKLGPEKLGTARVHESPDEAREHWEEIRRVRQEYTPPQPAEKEKIVRSSVQEITDFVTDDMCKIFSGMSALSTLKQDVTITASGGFEIKFFRNTARYKVLRILTDASREHPTMRWDMLYYDTEKRAHHDERSE